MGLLDELIALEKKEPQCLRPAIATAIKMLESLPEPAQEEVVEQLREYIAELQDERAWDARFERTQSQFAAAARRAKEAIAQRQAEPLDLDRL